jgi:GAG-pre-integrase domain
MIGEGYLQNGLYFLNIHRYGLNSKVQDNNLWHKRVGHPSDWILKYIFNFQNIDCSKCETYKLAKHTRLSFVTSNSKSDEIF